jgi:WD40 repeat protein
MEGQPDRRGWEWYYLDRLCQGSLHTFEHKYWVNAVAFSPDGKLLASAAGSPGRGTGDPQREGELKLWDVATGRLLATLLGDQPTPALQTVTFSQGGRWLMATDAANTWRVWEVASRRPCLAIQAVAAGFLPDGRTLAIVGAAGELKHLDLASSREVLVVRGSLLSRPDQQLLAAFSGDGQRVALRLVGDKKVQILDGGTGKAFATLASTGRSNYLQLSPQGRQLVDDDQLLDIESGRNIGSLGEMLHPARFSPSGSWLADCLGGGLGPQG